MHFCKDGGILWVRNQKEDFFHIGKNGFYSDDDRRPTVGEPNSNLDTYDKSNGSFNRRRRFGVDGYPVKDFEIKHKSNEYDHIHDWKDKRRSIEHRKPNKSEQREFNKAKKKRRFWKW